MKVWRHFAFGVAHVCAHTHTHFNLRRHAKKKNFEFKLYTLAVLKMRIAKKDDKSKVKWNSVKSLYSLKTTHTVASNTFDCIVKFYECDKIP